MQFLGDNRVSVNPQAAMEHMMGQQPAEEVKPVEEVKEEVKAEEVKAEEVKMEEKMEKEVKKEKMEKEGKVDGEQTEEVEL